jgi:hypothetical protein
VLAAILAGAVYLLIRRYRGGGPDGKPETAGEDRGSPGEAASSSSGA